MSGHEWAPEPGELRGDDRPLSPAVGPVPVFAYPESDVVAPVPPVEEDGPEPDPTDVDDAPEVRPRRLGFRFSLPKFRARRDGEFDAEEGEVEVIAASDSFDPDADPDAEDADSTTTRPRRAFRLSLPRFRRVRSTEDDIDDGETAIEADLIEPDSNDEEPPHSRRFPAFHLKREARVGLAAALSFAILVTVWITNKGRALPMAIPGKGDETTQAPADSKDDKTDQVAESDATGPEKTEPKTPPVDTASKDPKADSSAKPKLPSGGIGALASNDAVGEPAFPAAAPAPIDPATPATLSEMPPAAPAPAPIADALPPAGSPDPAEAPALPTISDQVPAMPGDPALPGDPSPPKDGGNVTLPAMPMPEPTPVASSIDEPKAPDPASAPAPTPTAPADTIPELPASPATPEAAQLPNLPTQTDPTPSEPPAVSEPPAPSGVPEMPATSGVPEMPATSSMPEMPAPTSVQEMPAPTSVPEMPAPTPAPEVDPTPKAKPRPPTEPRPAPPVPSDSPPPLDPVPATSPMSEVETGTGSSSSPSPMPNGTDRSNDLEDGFIRIKTGGKRVLVSTPTSDGIGLAAGASVLGGVAAASIADGPPPREDVVARDQVEPKLHRVRSGENFWTISRLYYGTGRYYRALHAANAREVPEIQELWVGTVIRVPPPETLDRSLVDPPTRERLVDQSNDSGDAMSRPHRDNRAAGATVSRTSNTTESDDAAQLAVPTFPRTRRRIEVESPEDPPTRPVYKVRGDHETLRGIARDTLGDARRYREIFNLNRSVLDEDGALAPGQTLTLPADAVIDRRGR